MNFKLCHLALFVDLFALLELLLKIDHGSQGFARELIGTCLSSSVGLRVACCAFLVDVGRFVAPEVFVRGSLEEDHMGSLVVKIKPEAGIEEEVRIDLVEVAQEMGLILEKGYLA